MKKIIAQKASELTGKYDAINEQVEEIDTELPPADYLKELIKHKFFEDAITFLAHGLPPRESVWWGCVCVRHVTDDATKQHSVAALQYAEQWVNDQSEQTRRVCGKYADEGQYKAPHHLLSAAVFWSGGSIMDESEPAIEPQANMYSHAVAGAILSAVGMAKDEDIDAVYNKYINHGVNIAQGGNG